VSGAAEAALWGLAVGGTLFAGAVVAARVQLPARFSAFVTAFGGGILLAAIALELVPEADERAGLWLTAAMFGAGTLVYVGADALLSRDREITAVRRSAHAAAAGRPMEMSRHMASAARGESIAAGIFVDGVPESLALGLTLAEGGVGVALLVGILVGNLVEAYGAAQPIIAAGRSRAFAVCLLGAIGVSLVGATVLGGTVLSDASDSLIGSAEALASGAVLAVVAISIVPYAFEEVSRWVAVATAAGFVAGYLLS
jgi:zinc transporter, ZIP family